ncbi:single-stranded DNA-binding protein [Saccharothrix isguenensis]
MAYNESRVTICGNVAGPVTHSKVGTGFSRAKFRLFTAERVWDPEDRAWSDGAKMFLTVTCWRMLADNAHASLNRGDPVVITGRLAIKDMEHDGKVLQMVEVEATAIGPNLALCTATPLRTRVAPDAIEARAAPEIVAPRKADELPLVFPTWSEAPEPEVLKGAAPKEAAEVPF